MSVQADAIRAAYPTLSGPQRRALLSLAEHGEWKWAGNWHMNTLNALEQRGYVEMQERPRSLAWPYWNVRITPKGREVLGDERP